MSITKLEINYYKNIERIATALEKIAAQGDQHKFDRINAASKLIYGNMSTGRSQKNYDYPNKVPHNQVPCINTDLEQRMYDESQKLTGAEFQGWYDKLTEDERNAYTRVYNF